MERQKSGKIIAVIALVVGVVGLSLGFAAFSTTLNITSSADVPIDESVWEVGFSTVNSGITAGTVTGTTTGSITGDTTGTINLSQFVISQNAVPTLHTTNDSKVEYDFYIVNDGQLDAYLNSVTMGTLSCAYATNGSRTTDDGHTTITSTTGETISSTDCNALFGAKLTIGSTEYEAGSAAITSGFGTTNMLAKPSGSPTSVAAKLTIYYKNDSLASVTNAPSGDFTVSLSDSTVVYGTTSN